MTIRGGKGLSSRQTFWSKWLSSQKEGPSVLFSPTGRWARRSTALRRADGGREKQSPPRGEARESRGCPGPLSSFPKSTPPGQARGTHLTNLAWGTFYRRSGTKQGEWEPLRDQGRPGRPSDECAVGCAAAGMPERKRDLRREAGEIRIKNGVYLITT